MYDLSSVDPLFMTLDTDGYFRREKAAQYPLDTRNLEAAEIHDRIGQELPSLVGSDLYRKVETLLDSFDAGDTKPFEIISDVKLAVGFRCGVRSARDYLEEIASRLEAELPHRISVTDNVTNH